MKIRMSNVECRGPKIGVLLLGFGAPDNLEAVEPFLHNILSGRGKISPLDFKRRLEKVVQHYREIGGRSPLLDITREQAQALEKRLNVGDRGFKVYIAMRHWHPYIRDTVEDIIGDGIKRMVVLSLSPQYTRMTTGSNIEELKGVLSDLKADLKADLEVTYIESWHDSPFYLDALAEKVEEGLAWFPEECSGKVQVIFSAHSLPKGLIECGDPYLEHLKATVAGVLERIGPVPWHLAFQSRGGPGEWLEPEIDSVLDRLAREGNREVLIVPISFISDNVEILYDIDIELRRRAESRGITKFHRALLLNASSKLIEALAQIVLEHLSKKG